MNDPTGTTQTMTDASGALVGRVVYDAFGGVLENTIPAELTSVYAELPDAASGLVHVGGGRWYDPMIGRPLQPNPAGGAPTAPQTMTRYTATPLGQPGVAAAMGQADLTVLSLAIGATKSSAAEILSRATWGALGRNVTTQISNAQNIASITASKTALARTDKVVRGWGGRLLTPDSLSELAGERELYEATFDIPIGKSTDELVKLAKLPKSGGYKATVSFSQVDEVIDVSRSPRLSGLGSLKFGLATDVLLGVGFQIYGDSYDPYLSTGQRIERVGWASLGGAFSFSGGIFTASLAASAFCGPGAPVCATAVAFGVAGSAVAGYVWNKFQPIIFEFRGLNSERNLSKFN